jgi:hypothetical protein
VSRPVGAGFSVFWLDVFFLRGDFGRLLVKLEDVALIKLVFAARYSGVGRARKIFCVVGMDVEGGGPPGFVPKADI